MNNVVKTFTHAMISRITFKEVIRNWSSDVNNVLFWHPLLGVFFCTMYNLLTKSSTTLSETNKEIL